MAVLFVMMVLFEGVTVFLDGGALLLFGMVVLFDRVTVLFDGVMVLFVGATVLFVGVMVLCSIAGMEGAIVGIKLEDRSALFWGKKEASLLSKEEKEDGEGVSLLGGAGPETSQEGGDVAALVPKIVPGWKGDELASRCSVNVTWKELKRRSDIGSQSR